MNNELQIINQQEVLGKDFKVYGDFENPLFLAKDVAEWIEYSKSGGGAYDVSRMVGTADEGEKQVRTIFISGQNREMWFLTEDGLYEVLMQSRKPIAKAFKKEVKAILKSIRKTGTYTASNLSPQLQLLIEMETEQRRQALALERVTERLDSIGDIVTLSPNSWRPDTRKLITSTAQKMGGNEYIRDLQTEIYTLVNERAGVSLETRLTNKRRRMADEGICKSSRDKLTKVDVIAEDKKLIEIYLAIVKELSVKYGVDSQ